MEKRYFKHDSYPNDIWEIDGKDNSTKIGFNSMTSYRSLRDKTIKKWFAPAYMKEVKTIGNSGEFKLKSISAGYVMSYFFTDLTLALTQEINKKNTVLLRSSFSKFLGKKINIIQEPKLIINELIAEFKKEMNASLTPNINDVRDIVSFFTLGFYQEKFVKSKEVEDKIKQEQLTNFQGLRNYTFKKNQLKKTIKKQILVED